MVTRNDRSDTPHLLASFGNPSNEIDIHLTWRTSGTQGEYQPIAKIPESAISSVFERLIPEFQKATVQHINRVRPVRPGWLAKKGYLISYLDDDAERKMIEMFAPRRKYHSKWERVLRAAGLEDYINSELPGETIFLPSVLHELKETKYSKPVLVARVRGKHKPRLTGIQLGVTAKGTLKWFPVHDVINPLMHLGELVVNDLKQLVPDDKWKLIWDELRLEEVGWLAKTVKEQT